AWSSDVCSSDLGKQVAQPRMTVQNRQVVRTDDEAAVRLCSGLGVETEPPGECAQELQERGIADAKGRLQPLLRDITGARGVAKRRVHERVTGRESATLGDERGGIEQSVE